MRRIAAACMVVAAVSTLASSPPALSRPGTASPPRHRAAAGPAFDPLLAGAQRATAAVVIGAQLEAAERARQLGEWLAAAAEHDREVQAAAAAAAARSAPAPASSSSSGGVGDCSGFPIPDWIIQRESGGNPNAVNPSSGAYGCAQELPAHFAPGGACAGLDMYSVDGQRRCAVILSDGGTNLSPWAG